MKASTQKILTELIQNYPSLEVCLPQIDKAVASLIACYANHHKVLVCGNGGSAADSEHIVGELMKGFLLNRKLDVSIQQDLKKLFPERADYLISNLQGALPAISLVSQTSLSTAFSNDKAPDLAFAQQVLGYGEVGDILLGISTSGNSSNVLYASQIAKYKGMSIISLTGRSGGKLRELSDVLIAAPADETFKIQEFHLPIYHAICAAIENESFCDGNDQ